MSSEVLMKVLYVERKILPYSCSWQRGSRRWPTSTPGVAAFRRRTLLVRYWTKAQDGLVSPGFGEEGTGTRSRVTPYTAPSSTSSPHSCTGF